MRRRFFLVANPDAGMAGIPLLEEVVATLERGGAVVTRSASSDVEGARREVRRAADSGSCDAVVAAGGDGTVRQVASALIGSDTPLGIIPLGTGNVLAHEIGLSPKADSVAQALVDGPSVPIACALANGVPFLLMTGAGFDARVLRALDQRLKSRIGKLAYAPPVLGALARPLDHLDVRLDGEAHRATWAVISNACHYAGGFVLARRTGIRRRGLEAILFKANSPGALVGQLVSLAMGQLDSRAARQADVVMVSCSQASITSHRPVPTQLDGDVFGTTPLEVDAGSSEVGLIVPITDGPRPGVGCGPGVVGAARVCRDVSA
jgi:diacylglycerol kinase (ATP)